MRRLLARHRRSIAAGLALGAGCAGGTAWAAFSSQASNGPNGFSAAPDQRAPVVDRSMIVKSQGGEVGYVRPGGTYHVYGQVADDDASPSPSGVASVRTGAGVTLSSGSFTAGGLAYNRRTAQQTLQSGTAAGTMPYDLVVADNAGNEATRDGYSVVVDGTAPATTDVQTANGGPIAGRPDIGDTITFSFSEPIDPQSVLAGWTGAPVDVTVRINNNSSNDQLLVYNSSNGTQTRLGTVSLAGNYVGSNRTFGASGTRSSMVRTDNAITVTLGTQSGSGSTVTSNTTMSWTPLTNNYDRAGNALPTTARTETGTGDREF